MDVIDPGWNFYLLQEKRKIIIDLLDRENENVIIKVEEIQLSELLFVRKILSTCSPVVSMM